MQVTILEPPAQLPSKWDLADPMPDFLDIAAVLAGPPKRKELADVVINTAQLAEMDIPERDCLIEPFIMVPSLNMLYAKRGLGKTWVSFQAAISIATGRNLFAYKTKRKGRVLLVDGEMVLADIKERFLSLDGGISEAIDVMPAESMYLEHISINLHEKNDRERLLLALQQLEKQGKKYDCLIFDNLSSLLSGADENDNTEQEAFLQFLISLRHAGYVVILIHHAGKSGDQRGASRREDMMDTVIKLDDPAPGAERHPGAHFVLKFTKTRGRAPVPAELDVRLVTGPNGKLTWAFSENSKSGRPDDALKAIYDNGPSSQNELAEIMKCTKSNVSQLLKRLRQEGHLSRSGLEITDMGKDRLAALWPSDYPELVQPEIPF